MTHRSAIRSSRAVLILCFALLCWALPFNAVFASDTSDSNSGVFTGETRQPVSVVSRFESNGPPSGRVHSFNLHSSRAEQSAVATVPADDLHPSVVIGTDERVRLSPAAAPIAYLELYDQVLDMVGSCTGTFIGPKVLLTAAHCLYDPDGFGGWAGDVAVVPGKDGEVEPFGYDWAVDAWVPDQWIASGATAELYDWGLIVLGNADLGNTVGWFGMAVLNDASLRRSDFQPTIIGYPGDMPDGTQWFATQPAFTEVQDFILRYTIDTAGGMSGSAVFRASDEVIAGIHVRGAGTYNEATRIDQEVLDDFINGCAQMNCTFAYMIEPPPTEPDVNAYQRTWERTDLAVYQGLANRTWIWGPDSLTGARYERYDDAEGGQRMVVYWDKSRMEITWPANDPFNEWYVTNGLLAKELISGMMQMGDNTHEYWGSAMVNVAGDGDDPTGPTYATFLSLLDSTVGFQETTITRGVTRDGVVFNDNRFALHNVGAAIFEPLTQHWVATPFWNFMNSSGTIYANGGYTIDRLFSNPYYATGLPITEAYWASVKIAGTYRDVLMQCFERRCLTYTPGNPPGWDVEAGNVGLHYYIWRYGEAP